MKLVKQWQGLIFAILGGGFIIEYMRLPFIGILFVLIVVIIYFAYCQKNEKINKKEYIGLLIFAIFLAIAAILGYHISINGFIYTSLLSENFMTDFTPNDIVAFLIMSVVFEQILETILNFIKRKANTIELKKNNGIESVKCYVIVSVLIFVLWLPYLYVYYPGFIFGDSFSSIAQALGKSSLNNHHPIAYTLFIRLCLNIGMALGDITLGCAIYSISQMLYISFCLGYMVCWLKNKGVSSKICAIVTVYFACTPFFAQSSIAMWKDPVFSATIAVWTMLLVDFAFVVDIDKEVNKYFFIKHVIFMLIMCFIRNNGFYIALFFEFICIVVCVVRKDSKKRNFKNLLKSTTVVLILVYVITGPVYSKLNLSGPTVESLGIFLNQMANVVANDGNMSDADKEYMDNLLPLEKYKETYRPCVVDLLKWDTDFNQAYLEENKGEFIKTYFSMLVKNPVLYLQAWALNTYGYWAYNQWELNFSTGNIEAGNLWNQEHFQYYGIETHNYPYEEQEDITSIIQTRGGIFSLANLTWFILFIVLLLVLNNRNTLWMAIAPSVGIIATLIVATPHAYWERYGLAEYYLLPVYILLLFYAAKEKEQEG